VKQYLRTQFARHDNRGDNFLKGVTTMLVCGKCRGELKTKTVGVAWAQRREDHSIYRLYSADVKVCDECEIEILCTAHVPFMESHTPGFDEAVTGLEERKLLY
jgi:hypothetical protein